MGRLGISAVGNFRQRPGFDKQLTPSARKGSTHSDKHRLAGVALTSSTSVLTVASKHSL